MGGCCAEFCQRLRRPGDTEKDDRLRRLILPVSATFILVTGFAIFSRFLNLGTAGMWGPYVVGCAVVGVVCSFLTVFILTRMPGSYTTLVSVAMLPVLIGLLAIDLANMSTMDFRMWPVIVILMDVLIVIESKRGVQLVIVGLTLAWLAVMAAEEVAKFGALEFGQNGQPDAGRPVLCQCDSPPCAISAGTSTLNWLLSSCVFVMDFHFTRGFATGLRHQLDVNSATVRVSERLVQLLADYSTEDARKLIEAEGMALPEELHASYEQLLDNLDSYRVFLPDALLYSQQQGQQGEGDGDDTLGAGRYAATGHPVRAVAPGQGGQTPDVAVSFTDIQSSTELWEAHPQAMYTGLIMHNEVMRASYAACNGYEVKTIGDSFMVAFDGPFDAVRFGLEAQMGLLRQEWPEDLLTHPLCAPALSSDGAPLWGGLRVRIGVQYGSVRPEISPVTGRCDYFGHTINTAARLEAVLKKGGLVAISDTVVSALCGEGLVALGSPVLHDAGPRELKGVREPVHVWALVPRELAERVEVLREGHEPPPTPAFRSSRIPDAELAQRGSDASNCSGGERGFSRPLRSRVRKLQSSAATCAAVRLSLCRVDSVLESYQNLAAAATVAADRTQGVVDSVVSATVTVTWNASRPCADHVAACRCFLGTPFRMPCHLGAASGQVLWGNITAGRRSFATVIGGCVDLATALAEEAERCGDTALVTGGVVDSCYAKDAATWAQLWQAPGCPPMVVMAVCFSDTDDLRFAGNSTQEPTDTLLEHSIAGIFRKACAGEPGSPEQQQALEQLEEIGDQAAVGGAAAALAERIRSGGVRTRAMPRLWMGGQDTQQRAPPGRVESTPSLPELLAASCSALTPPPMR